MSRLCDSWTKSDDDKADTSRMNDDKEEIVEVNDKNEIEMLETKVNSYGHKPRMRYTGPRMSTRPHRNLEKELRDESGIRRRPRLSRTGTGLRDNWK